MQIERNADMNVDELNSGEMVYKIIAQLDSAKLAQQFKTFHNIMSPQQVLVAFTGYSGHLDALAKHKKDGRYYRISTHLLGYVVGTRVGGGWEWSKQHNVLQGYQVSWHTHSAAILNNFEDEKLLLPLREIIILSPQQLWTELKNDNGTEETS